MKPSRSHSLAAPSKTVAFFAPALTAIEAFVSSRPRCSPRALLALVGLASFAASNAATLTVSTPAELQAALVSASSGDIVLVRAGVYVTAQPLVVGDGVTVLGEGSMRLADGLPTGFDPIGETVVQASPALVGDLVTLGHGTILSCLSLRDAPGRAGGNVLVVSSRSPADIVSATILECEIFNPNMPGIGPQGPVGRALAVITRNLNFANPPPPHEQSAMTVRMTRTLVRTVQSNPAFCSGVWAHNFASHCTIKLTLTDNVLGGGIELIGGNSRPEAVAGSSVDLDSRQNLYRSDTVVPQPIGWTFIGGTIAPVPGVPGPSTNNRVQVLSVDDRIEGFQTAIFATGARRPSLVAPPVQGNQVLLSVHGAQLSSLTRDLMLRGAESFAGPVGVDTNNSVHVVLSNSVGSGVRANLYTHGTEQGAGNQLEIVGSSRSFAHSNEQILPAPDAEFFSSSR